MQRDFLSINPWKIDESGYPASGSIREQLTFCVNYAVLAPSTHNTQPWLFRPLDDSIKVYADHSRALPEADPDGREMMISCGAALANLLLAIHRFGHEGWVQYAPDSRTPELVARVRVGRTRIPDHHDESLFRSIRRRRSVRKPFQPRPIPRELQGRLIWLASEFGCWLYFAESDENRTRIAELVEKAHNRQLANPAYQAERTAWLGSGDNSSGTSTRSLQPATNGQPTDNGMDAASYRNLSPGKRWPERDRELIKASPAMFVLGTSSDTLLEWLRAGEALQRILLRAETESVSASFLNQPCQLPDLRDELRLITGRNGPPQVMVRMGYSTGTEETSRRPARDVILTSHDD